MGRNPGLKLSEKQKNELRSTLKEVKDARSFRAISGVLLRGEGHTADWIAKNLGISKKQVFVWCGLYKINGIKGLFLRKPPGRSPVEGKKAKKRIPELLREDPQLFGFLKGRWVVRDISKELKREGIDLSFQSVSRLLSDLNISLTRPKLISPGSINKNYKKRKEIANYKTVSNALQKKGFL